MSKPYRRASLSRLFLCAGLASGCLKSAEESSASELNVVTSIPYAFEGIEETFLAADDHGTAAIVHVGKSSTRVAVTGMPKSYLVSAVAAPGGFRALAADGSLISIDSAKARVAKSVATKLSNASDFAIERDDSAAYITTKNMLYKVDPKNGKIALSLDLTSLRSSATSKVSLRSLLRIRDQILVQVAREGATGSPERGAVAIIEAKTLTLSRVIELEVKEPAASALIGSNPGGPFVLDDATNSIYVTALGDRFSIAEGGTFRLNAKTLALEPWTQHYSAYQGTLTLGPVGAKPRYAFTGEHTRTPVTSTHVRRWIVDPVGVIKEPENGTILDVFEGVESFPGNQAKTLFALPVSCLMGFCLGGAGVALIDARSGVVLPRVLEADLGFKPSIVVFAAP
jgi:hypothetical protein